MNRRNFFGRFMAVIGVAAVAPNVVAKAPSWGKIDLRSDAVSDWNVVPDRNGDWINRDIRDYDTVILTGKVINCRFVNCDNIIIEQGAEVGGCSFGNSHLTIR